MDQNKVKVALNDTWSAVLDEYRLGRIHNEAELQICFAKLLDKTSGAVWSQALIRYNKPGNANLQARAQADLVWVEETNSDGNYRVLAIIELKYRHYPGTFADISKFADIQTTPAAEVEVGFTWSKCLQNIPLHSEIVYVVASIGLEGADAFHSDFAQMALKRLVAEGRQLPYPVLAFQIMQPLKGGEPIIREPIVVGPLMDSVLTGLGV